MRLPLTFRSLFRVGGIVCFVFLGSAYLLEYAFHLVPCPLCLLQRYLLWMVTCFFWLGVLDNPGNVGRLLYSISIIFFSSLGAAFAGRHLWILHVPSTEIPSCSAGLEKMLATLPILDALKSVLSGSQSCMQSDLLIFGLSLPMWSLLSFISIIVFVGIIMQLQLKRRI
jgi:protein dithiol:quinone oxidoreductase